jgi:hypothetical protein
VNGDNEFKIVSALERIATILEKMLAEMENWGRYP